MADSRTSRGERDGMGYSEALWIYLVLLFGIIVVPGMDMFFVIANALTGGRRPGSPRLAASCWAARCIRCLAPSPWAC